jgi:hypothetical protein
MLPVEKHVSDTGAQLNDDQRLAVLAHMTTPDRGNSFPYDEPTMNRNNGVTNALASGDTHGIIYHLLYNNFVAPKLHQAATAIKSDYQKVSKVVGGVVENLPFGIGKSDAAPKSATSVPYDRAVPAAYRGTPTAAVPYDNATSVPYSRATPSVGSLAIEDVSGSAHFGGLHPLTQVDGLVIHHTGPGMNSVDDVMRTFTERGYPAQFVIDRDGQVFQTLPTGMSGRQIEGTGKLNADGSLKYPSVANMGLSNANTIGVEIMASNDKDVAPAQIAASKQLFQYLSADPSAADWKATGLTSDQVYGHGALNPGHKQATEGMTAANAIKASFPATDTTAAATAAGTSAASYARATQFVGAAAAASALPSYDSYSLGHVMMGSNPLRESIIGAAKELGVNPVDLGTAISYETAGTLDPNQKGPTTKWGEMRGLIQMGEPQRVQYKVGDKTGITVSIPDQMRGIVKYLQDTGVKPGMGLKNIYAAINAGDALHVYAYDRGTTVLEKVAKMGPNRAQAEKLLGDAIPYEAKIASVVTGAGISANGMFERPPENYVGGGAAVYGGFTPVRASTHPLSAVVVTGAGNGGPFSTFTYGPGASTILSGGMGAGYQPQHSGSGNYSNVGEGGQPSHGGGGTGTGGGSGFSQDHGGSGNNSPGSYSNSTSGNSSGVGEGGVGSSYGSSGGGSAPSRSYSGSGNYSNVGEGGVSHSSPTSPENHTPVGSNGMFGSGV